MRFGAGDSARPSMSIRFAALASVATALLAGSVIPAAAEPAPPCPQVAVVFARGTFEAPGVGVVGQQFVNALNATLPQGVPVAVYPVDYPASLDFDAATSGISDASHKVVSIAADCPATRIVLGGYSQGAAVAAYTTFDAVPPGLALPVPLSPMPPDVAPHVAAVALFGTPDNWFLNLVAHGAPPITVGHLYADKTIELCVQGDPVCSPGGLDRSAHSAYKTNDMPSQAAQFVVNALGNQTTNQEQQ